MFYGEDQDGISEIVEANAVVAGAEAELRRLNVLELLDIAYARGEITSHDTQDAKRGGLVDSAKVGFGLLGLGDLPPRRHWPVPWGSRGARPMLSKSSEVRPNSASTSSWEMGS